MKDAISTFPFPWWEGGRISVMQRGGMYPPAGVTARSNYTRMVAIAHDCNVGCEE